MDPQDSNEHLSTLEEARRKLYSRSSEPRPIENPLPSGERTLPHVWEGSPKELPKVVAVGSHHVRFAAVFFAGASAFFLLALMLAGYFFYFGGNAVSVNNITVQLSGPTSIAGGDTVPLGLAVTNRNPVAVKNVKIEIAFPEGTRNAEDVLKSYPRYTETIDVIASGETITRSIRAVVFGGAGQSLSLPVSVSFGTDGSNSVFVKKLSYALDISSTPLSISVETLRETVSGKPLTLTLTVRSNASVPLGNVIVTGTLPFGFSVSSASVPFTNSAFSLGTLMPGATKTITLSGTLSGQNSESRVFRFSVGTAKNQGDTTIAVPYMTQDATVALAAPFLATNLSINGSGLDNAVLSPGSTQTVSIGYANMLPTTLTNAIVTISLSGAAIDYNSIKTTTGFYRSQDRSIVFSKDTDPSFSSLAPGASGVGDFTFSTLPASSVGRSPQVTFSISVAGTRVGQSNVPEQVSASSVVSAKLATSVGFSALSLHSSGPITNSGPIPPKADFATTYTIQWSATNPGNSIGGGSVSTTLPGYVSYTGKTSGSGTFSYDEPARKITWSVGDLAQGATATGAFQVSLTPSTSQKGSAPQLTGAASFTGFDRFAGVSVSASAEAVTTETRSDVGFNNTKGNVQ